MRAAAGSLGRRRGMSGLLGREAECDLSSDWLADMGGVRNGPEAQPGPGENKGAVWWQGWRKEDRRRVMTLLLDILRASCSRGTGQAGVGNAGQGAVATLSPLRICTALLVEGLPESVGRL